MLDFGNRYGAKEIKSSGLKTLHESVIRCQIFEELVSEMLNDVSAEYFSFYLDDFYNIYTNRLKLIEVETAVNKTYVKAKALSYLGTDQQETKKN